MGILPRLKKGAEAFFKRNMGKAKDKDVRLDLDKPDEETSEKEVSNDQSNNCPNCQGTGIKCENTCKECNGTGIK